MADDNNSFNESCCFSLMVFAIVTGCFVVQTVGFAKQNPFAKNNGSNLCVVLPDRYECNSVREYDEKNNTILSTAEEGYLAFLVMEGMCVGIQLIAFFAVCSRILICAEIFCVTCCYGCWKNVCIHCGFTWIVLEGFSGILCISGCIVLGVVLTTSEIVSFEGIPFIIANGCLQILKVAGAIGYHKTCGCPPHDVFYGSTVRYSDIKIKKTRVQHTSTDANGNVSTYYTTNRTMKY